MPPTDNTIQLFSCITLANQVTTLFPGLLRTNYAGVELGALMYLFSPMNRGNSRIIESNMQNGGGTSLNGTKKKMKLRILDSSPNCAPVWCGRWDCNDTAIPYSTSPNEIEIEWDEKSYSLADENGEKIKLTYNADEFREKCYNHEMWFAMELMKFQMRIMRHLDKICLDQIHLYAGCDSFGENPADDPLSIPLFSVDERITNPSPVATTDVYAHIKQRYTKANQVMRRFALIGGQKLRDWTEKQSLIPFICVSYSRSGWTVLRSFNVRLLLHSEL